MTNHRADVEREQIVDKRERDVDVTRPEWEDDLPARELTEQEREDRKHLARSLGLPGDEPSELNAALQLMLVFSLLLLLAGALLLYAGFRGSDPRDDLRAFLTGKKAAQAVEKSIAAAALGTFLLVFADDARQGKVHPSAFIGILIGFLMLAFLAGPMPGVARGFAWLIFAVTALNRGPSVLQGVSHAG